MIFEGYEEYITERTIYLSQYLEEKSDENNFFENFFQDIPGNTWENHTVKTLVQFWKKKEKSNNLIEQLIDEEVTHILLILSQKAINDIRKKTKSTYLPKDFTKNFIERIINEFESYNINCSIFIDNLINREETKDLEQWLNLRELKKIIQSNRKKEKEFKHVERSYLFGFKNMKLTNSNSKNDILLNINENNLILKKDCSILLGNNKIFKYNIPTSESIIKITNNTEEGFIDFITNNIKNITSNHYQLQEDYFNYKTYDSFELNANELKKDDVEIKFDKTSIVLSNTIPTITVEDKEEPTKEPIKQKKEETPNSSTIGTDTDDDKSSLQNINIENDYFVTLNRFVTPYENDLKEVHYHLIKNQSKLILVGGSKSDPKENALAKVVANLADNRIEVTNLSAQPMSFKISENRVEYQISRGDSNKIANTIDTDESKTQQELTEVTLKKGESHSFKECIEFPNSAIEFNENGVEVEYINFIIGSFNNKLEFNRHYFRHFETGNIIDNQENLDYAGRIYAEGKKNILGSTISRNPMLLTLRGRTFTLSNQIKEQYTLLTKTATKESEISYKEEESFSKDELLSKPNHLSITKDGIVLIEISIQAN